MSRRCPPSASSHSSLRGVARLSAASGMPPSAHRASRKACAASSRRAASCMSPPSFSRRSTRSALAFSRPPPPGREASSGSAPRARCRSRSVASGMAHVLTRNCSAASTKPITPGTSGTARRPSTSSRTAASASRSCPFGSTTTSRYSRSPKLRWNARYPSMKGCWSPISELVSASSRRYFQLSSAHAVEISAVVSTMVAGQRDTHATRRSIARRRMLPAALTPGSPSVARAGRRRGPPRPRRQAGHARSIHRRDSCGCGCGRWMRRSSTRRGDRSR